MTSQVQPQDNITSIVQHKEDEEDWVTAGRPYDINVWYDAVRDITPSTWFANISDDEVDAMITFYRLEFLVRDRDRNADEEKKTLLRIQPHLTSLAQKIIHCMKQPPHASSAASSSPQGWFVRFSCRSPKDGLPAPTQQAKDNKEEGNIVDAVDNPNATLGTLMRMQTQRLRVKSAFEAMHLLCTSERVFRDLIKTREHKLSTEMAVRLWNPEFSDAWEFRCFVHHRVLTAISQYNHYVMWDQLQGNELMIAHIIELFYQKHRDIIPYESCVMDLALVPKYDASGFIATVQTHLIEFNPFDRYTGASMFDWKRDEQQLQNGPLELRLRTTPLENVDQLVDCWREMQESDQQQQQQKRLRHESYLRNCCADPHAQRTLFGNKGKCTLL
jgi:hypothetical protein